MDWVSIHLALKLVAAIVLVVVLPTGRRPMGVLLVAIGFVALVAGATSGGGTRELVEGWGAICAAAGTLLVTVPGSPRRGRPPV